MINRNRESNKIDNIFRITYNNNTVCIKHFTDLSNADLINASSQFVGYDKFEEMEYIVWDLTNVSVINTDNYTAELLTSFIQRYTQYNQKIKTVYITDNHDLRLTINEHIQLLRKTTSHTRLFRSVNEFIVWSSTQQSLV